MPGSMNSERTARGPIRLDDPEALDKLRIKLEHLKRKQEIMKKVNVIVRSRPKNISTAQKIAEIMTLGLSERAAQKVFEPDFAGRIGIPSYELQNNRGNMKRVEERITELEYMAERSEHQEKCEGFEIVEDKQEHRIKIIFPDKPSEYVRRQLRRHGFRWSPTNKAWQRHLNKAGIAAAGYVKHLINGSCN